MKRLMQAIREILRLVLDPPPHQAAVELERHAERVEKQSKRIDKDADEFATMVYGMRAQGNRPRKKSKATRRK